MKKTLSTLFLFLFIIQLSSSQSVRYFGYDGAGNRIWRKDHINADPDPCSTSLLGYTKLGEHNGHAYFMSEISKTWQDAKLLAENEGGYLATMNNSAENDWLKNQLGNEMVFIGFNDALTEGVWQWANNESVALNLNYGNGADNDYAVMNFWAGTWQMANQWVSKKYILEIDCGNSEPSGNLTIACPENINVTTTDFTEIVTWNAATATTTCSVNTDVTVTQTGGEPSGSVFPIGVPFTITYEATDNCSNTETCSFTVLVSWTQTGCGEITGYTKLGELGGHGYYLSDNSKNWTQAEAQVVSDGGHLATMNTQAENDWLKSKLNNNMVFIGYNDAVTEDVGVWSSGETPPLDLSYGNSADNDFAVMNFWAGTWQMVNQWVSKKFILEKDCSGPPVPQPSPKVVPLTDMILYPNPTDGIFKIEPTDEVSESTKVYFYNSLGMMIFSRNFENGVFDISSFEAGSYLLVLQDDKSRFYLKVIKAD